VNGCIAVRIRTAAVVSTTAAQCGCHILQRVTVTTTLLLPALLHNPSSVRCSTCNHCTSSSKWAPCTPRFCSGCRGSSPCLRCTCCPPWCMRRPFGRCRTWNRNPTHMSGLHDNIAAAARSLPLLMLKSVQRSVPMCCELRHQELLDCRCKPTKPRPVAIAPAVATHNSTPGCRKPHPSQKPTPNSLRYRTSLPPNSPHLPLQQPTFTLQIQSKQHKAPK
jgi:hypothetical protein